MWLEEKGLRFPLEIYYVKQMRYLVNILLLNNRICGYASEIGKRTKEKQRANKSNKIAIFMIQRERITLSHFIYDTSTTSISNNIFEHIVTMCWREKKRVELSANLNQAYTLHIHNMAHSMCPYIDWHLKWHSQRIEMRRQTKKIQCWNRENKMIINNNNSNKIWRKT